MVTSELRPSPIVKPKLLLVEGPDEVHVFSALLSYLGDMPEIQIMPYDGKDNLGPYLRTLVAGSGFQNVTGIGIFRDADHDSEQAFQSVCSALGNAQLPIPSTLLTSSGTMPQIIVAIIPPDSSTGELEDVLMASVSGDPAVSCVDDFLECLESRVGTLPQKLSKARLHAFLASREQPDLLAGQAAWAEYFPWDSEAFVPIINFLRQLSAP